MEIPIARACDPHIVQDVRLCETCGHPGYDHDVGLGCVSAEELCYCSRFMPACPHEDPTCPCQDGDPCHYEPCEDAPTESGKLPMRCPRTGILGCTECG